MRNPDKEKFEENHEQSFSPQWKNLYLLIAIALILEVAVFAWVTQYFR